MKAIKKSDYIALLKQTFESAIKREEISDIVNFEIDVNSIYAVIKYNFESNVHNESSCVQSVERIFKEILKKYIPEDALEIKLIASDKTFYINIAYTVTD